MFQIAKPSDGEIQDFLAGQARSRFSVDTSRLIGYTTDHNRLLLGYGEDVWSRAVRAINNWQMFNH